MINIITALYCEAKPLIQHYRLNGRQVENGFGIYENDTMRLIIGGVGKCAAAAACAYLQGLEPECKHIWLNLGIAGHATLPVGNAILAHKITDAATNHSWYPPLLVSPPCQTEVLISVDQAKTDYTSEGAYDMEASGFYATASRFNSGEWVQVVKIISDNHANPVHQLSKKLVQQIIAGQLNTLDTLIKQLLELNERVEDQRQKPAIESFLQQWHFTVAQQHKLLRLLFRWQALTGTTVDFRQFVDQKNSAAVLTALEKEIARLPIRFERADND